MGWIGTEVFLDILGLLYGTNGAHLKQAKKILDGANDGPRDKRKSMKPPPIGEVVSAANVCHPDQSTAESPGVFPAQNSGRLKGQFWLQPSSLLHKAFNLSKMAQFFSQYGELIHVDPSYSMFNDKHKVAGYTLGNFLLAG